MNCLLCKDGINELSIVIFFYIKTKIKCTILFCMRGY